MPLIRTLMQLVWSTKGFHDWTPKVSAVLIQIVIVSSRADLLASHWHLIGMQRDIIIEMADTGAGGIVSTRRPRRDSVRDIVLNRGGPRFKVHVCTLVRKRSGSTPGRRNLYKISAGVTE